MKITVSIVVDPKNHYIGPSCRGSPFQLQFFKKKKSYFQNNGLGYFQNRTFFFFFFNIAVL